MRGGGCPRNRHTGRTGRRSAEEGRGPQLGHSAETTPAQQIYRTPALPLHCILQCFRSKFSENRAPRFIAPCGFAFRSRPEMRICISNTAMNPEVNTTCVLTSANLNIGSNSAGLPLRIKKLSSPFLLRCVYRL